MTRLPCWRLAVGFGAVADGVDDEGVVGFFGEADAVVADAEAKLFGVALELLDVVCRLSDYVADFCSNYWHT